MDPLLESCRDDDPYLWLEDIAGPAALAWVEERNAEALGQISGNRQFSELYQRLLAILDAKDRLPFVAKRGPFFYNFWQDDANKRGLWRRTMLAEYRKPLPDWETVLDIDHLAQAENEPWAWKGSIWLGPGFDRCLVSLSRGGADAAVVREFDPLAKAFVKGGFAISEAKTRVAWCDQDTLLVATDFGPGTLTDSGYPRQVRIWKRDTDLHSAPVLYEGPKNDVGVSAFYDYTPGFERTILIRAKTCWAHEFLLLEGNLEADRWVKLDLPDDARASLHREWLFILLQSSWEIGAEQFGSGSLIAIPLHDFLAGGRDFHQLYSPGPGRALEYYAPTRNYLLLKELDNVCSRIWVMRFADGAWSRKELGGLPGIADVNVDAIDPVESDDYSLTADSYLTPVSLAFGSLGEGSSASVPEMLKQAPAFFETQGLGVSQHFAVSADGTRVPYFQVAPSDLPLDGQAPCLLYGYGGFLVSLTPNYAALMGKAWLERGGVYVVANIRGGGELGPEWHRAALRENRHRSYEDFIAVADDLIRRNVTAPRHLGIRGGSNGGLLMGNMLVSYPERFRAIVCQAPLLDMRRYHRMLAGASWVAEYGDPDRPEDWAFIRAFSPYHNLDAAARYPRTLFTTSTRDDRVHPGHARKVVAKMLAQGHLAHYYECLEGGHAGSTQNQQRAFVEALVYTFLSNELR